MESHYSQCISWKSKTTWKPWLKEYISTEKLNNSKTKLSSFISKFLSHWGNTCIGISNAYVNLQYFKLHFSPLRCVLIHYLFLIPSEHTFLFFVLPFAIFPFALLRNLFHSDMKTPLEWTETCKATADHQYQTSIT